MRRVSIRYFCERTIDHIFSDQYVDASVAVREECGEAFSISPEHSVTADHVIFVQAAALELFMISLSRFISGENRYDARTYWSESSTNRKSAQFERARHELNCAFGSDSHDGMIPMSKVFAAHFTALGGDRSIVADVHYQLMQFMLDAFLTSMKQVHFTDATADGPLSSTTGSGGCMLFLVANLALGTAASAAFARLL
jgi:hypothetical protein